MCGRYVIKDSRERFSEFFDIDAVLCSTTIRYNIPPATGIPVIRLHEGKRILEEMRWGFEGKMINARAETVHRLPAFRDAFATRRCIVPASGYYEWRKLPDGTRQPYFFTRKDRCPLAFAGLWHPGNPACVVTITTEPNAEASAVHHRMPVLVGRRFFARYLDAGPLTESERREILGPAPAGLLDVWPVSRRVGNVRHDDPDLMERLREDGGFSGPADPELPFGSET